MLHGEQVCHSLIIAKVSLAVVLICRVRVVVFKFATYVHVLRYVVRTSKFRWLSISSATRPTCKSSSILFLLPRRHELLSGEVKCNPGRLLTRHQSDVTYEPTHSWRAQTTIS